MSGMLQPEVLVLGGTGTVGGGVVAALLEAGSRVLAVGRSGERLKALRRRFADAPGLETLVGSVADDQSAEALAAAIAERERPLAAVVASLGSPLTSGRLIDRPASALLRRLQRDLLPHLAAARQLLPLLADLGGRYVLVGSPCALRPWAGHGETSVTASATRMLAQVLHEKRSRWACACNCCRSNNRCAAPRARPRPAANGSARWQWAAARCRCWPGVASRGR